MNIKTGLIIALLFFAISTKSQNKEFEIGKIDISELQNKLCPIDSNAGAYVIGDYGRSYINIKPSGEEFEIIFERKVRIKILKNSEFNKATVEFSIFSGSEGFEKYGSVKGFTYNLENGAIVKSKLTSESQFEELVYSKEKNIKITMPNIKEGSVIDLEYRIVSPYVGYIRDWYFQWDIPVLYSQYAVEIPEFFSFKKFLNGYVRVASKEEKGSESFTYNNSQKVYLGSGKSGNSLYNSSTIKYELNKTILVATNVPAFKTEPYLSSIRNYISHIEYQIQSVRLGSYHRDYTMDWNSIREQLLNDEEFGGRLKHCGFIKDIVAKITQGIYNPTEKAKAIYDYLKNYVKWNNENGKYAENDLKKVYENKSGSSSEINLLLTAMLREAGINSEPAILSTRNNGIVIIYLPDIRKFNYTISTAFIGSDTILLDATDHSCPFGLLPERCLNDKGEIISTLYKGDISLLSNTSNSESTLTELKLNPENGELTGKIQNMKKGYYAYECRNNFFKTGVKKDYIEKIQDSNTGIKIGSYELKNFDSVEIPVQIILNDVAISGKAELAGNIISIAPIIFDRINENPFKDEERKYPVDLMFPRNRTYMMNFDIPKGYVVDELPKSGIISLPGNAAKYTYTISSSDGKVQLMVKLSISKLYYFGDEYKELREFYNKIVAKEGELIVLKKSDAMQGNK